MKRFQTTALLLAVVELRGEALRTDQCSALSRAIRIDPTPTESFCPMKMTVTWMVA
jgi:hypothetical protein